MVAEDAAACFGKGRVLSKLKGQRFGDWRLERQLGTGGNGSVWLAVNSKGERAAVKLLSGLYGRNSEKTYERFRNEVGVVRANNDIEGVLPIIDFFLPEEIKDDVPWYAMPVAQTLSSWLSGKNFEAAIEAILNVGKTLAALHKRGISHRDIKPANVLVRDGKDGLHRKAKETDF